jgi:sulfite reductase alpha subunit-like flavoprotein
VLEDTNDIGFEGGKTQSAAKTWMADLARQHRYLRDVY